MDTLLILLAIVLLAAAVIVLVVALRAAEAMCGLGFVNGSPDADDLALDAVGSALQQPRETVLVEHRYAQFDGLVELRAG